MSYGTTWTLPLVAVAALTLIAAVALALRGREGWSFTATATTIALATVVLFGSLFPNVLPSTTDALYSLTVENASSADYTLSVMTWVAVIFLPVVLLYQSWSYWVFRKRITREHIEPTLVLAGRANDNPSTS